MPETAKHGKLVGDIWVRVFTEVVAVNGIVSSVAVSIAVALIALTLVCGDVCAHVRSV
jgi:hypothetical protein